MILPSQLIQVVICVAFEVVGKWLCTNRDLRRAVYLPVTSPGQGFETQNQLKSGFWFSQCMMSPPNTSNLHCWGLANTLAGTLGLKSGFTSSRAHHALLPRSLGRGHRSCHVLTLKAVANISSQQGTASPLSGWKTNQWCLGPQLGC